ncbi:MAG TPA: G/U mismatch-specific DNA glycosylase [Gemmataceae bacterium]|nr:G/U mismatch-specific DNA glycosylase [Gemmataceae bacterium]
MSHPRPTHAQLLAAADRIVPDVIARHLKVLFCGINPGLYSAFTGHHFARPGNRFWPTLHAAGFTDQLLSPYEERLLLDRGYGITNVVDRASAAADELSTAEFVEGGRRLKARVGRYRPRYLAVLGVGAYRVAFDRPKSVLGLKEETIGDTNVWVLPNPSGLNAHYRSRDLAKLFRELRQAVEAVNKQ